METHAKRPKRSVLHAEAAASRPPKPVPRHHSARLEREQRLQRFVLAGVAIAVLIALLVPAYGYWKNVIRAGDAPLVVVNGQTITAQDYARYLGTRQEILTSEMQRLATLAQPAAKSSNTKPTPEQLSAQQVLSQLQTEQSGLSTTALTDLIEAKLVLAEASKRHLTASQAQMNDAVRFLFSPPAPGASAGYGIDALPATLPVTNTVSLTQANQDLNGLIGKGKFLDKSQIEELIVKPMIFKAQLEVALSGNIASTADEVHARHILVKTKAEAESIRAQLLKGANFADLAKKYSIDTGSKNKGGDLGWFPRGIMTPNFEKAAFSLKVGQISQPIQTQFGYHIIEVLAKDPHHPVSALQLAQLRNQAYQSWLSKQESDSKTVKYELTSQSMTWVHNYVQQGN